jgi:hypothetical protein
MADDIQKNSRRRTSIVEREAKTAGTLESKILGCEHFKIPLFLFSFIVRLPLVVLALLVSLGATSVPKPLTRFLKRVQHHPESIINTVWDVELGMRFSAEWELGNMFHV